MSNIFGLVNRAEGTFRRIPLHHAVLNAKDATDETKQEYLDVIRTLVENGAQADAKDREGKTPVDYLDDAKIQFLVPELREEIRAIIAR